MRLWRSKNFNMLSKPHGAAEDDFSSFFAPAKYLAAAGTWSVPTGTNDYNSKFWTPE